jgi:signal transduction histidine kinase
VAVVPASLREGKAPSAQRPNAPTKVSWQARAVDSALGASALTDPKMVRSEDGSIDMRTRRAATVVGWTTLVVTCAFSVAWAALGLARGGSVPGIKPYPIQNLEYALASIVTAGVAALIAIRRFDNRTWIPLAVMAIVGAAGGFLGEYAILALVRRPGILPGGEAAAWIAEWIFAVFLTANLFLLQIFPTGRPLSVRWGRTLWLAVAGGALYAIPFAFSPGFSQNWPPGSAGPIHNPWAIPAASPVLQALKPAAAGCLGLAGIFGFASVVQRFRRSQGDERQQLKLFVFIAAVGAIGVALPGVLTPGGPHTFLWWVQFVATTGILPLGVPLAIGVAILRYRLYDLDIVFNRALVYGALAAFITLVYVGIVVGIGALVGSGGRASLLLSIVATAIVAVAFQPARQWMQRAANRVVYGRRASPYEVLAELSARAGEVYAPDDVAPRIARALAEGTGAQRAEVWITLEGVLHRAASWPESPSAEVLRLPSGNLLPTMPGVTRAVAVRHQGELLGALSITKKAGDSLKPVESKLLDDLALQAGLVLKNFGLTAELRARVEDLRASRQRLVTAQDEERRRIERNLHDGAQQHLVALKVKINLLEMFADKEPAKVRPMLADVKASIDEAVDALHELARGVYPPLLAERGLAAALQAHVRKATLPVEVQADGVERYPAELEAAVYFCCLEALQNVQKYAAAKRALVTIAGTSSGISFSVSDDGAGFDTAKPRRGSGLDNMADRVAAMGGDLQVISSPGRGTRVQGSLPATTMPGT